MATTAEDLIQHHRFTVGEYQPMGETGFFHEDDRVELIEGEIIEMPPTRTCFCSSRSPSRACPATGR